MERTLVITKDGSPTFSIPGMNVSYHSLHGAIQESMHVFIREGLNFLARNSAIQYVHILEMGFGTGLNALLTLVEANPMLRVKYTAIELFPLTPAEARTLNYCDRLKRNDLSIAFEQLHQCEWEKEIVISPHFTLHKVKNSLLNLESSKLFHGSDNGPHLVYFDAFAPAAQPGLWTKEIFEMLYSMMMPKGVLVTYCSKGNVRRAMQSAGFVVEKIPGPPGKREIVRATRKI